MAAGAVEDAAVDRGALWLLRHQDQDGSWPEQDYTGTGFPRVFYLRYHGYARLFPLWALARVRNLRRGIRGWSSSGSSPRTGRPAVGPIRLNCPQSAQFGKIPSITEDQPFAFLH
ncbi:hypothetical protein ACFQY5_21600 [Paeniroseomonas aquatica]|uniref:hypothetical protein n=1 Tax=Paeniroseomonas aquatica TaxID=373043 RepID=UPI003619FD65